MPRSGNKKSNKSVKRKNMYHMYTNNRKDSQYKDAPVMTNVPHLDMSDFSLQEYDARLRYKHTPNTKKSVVMIFANWCGPCSRDKPYYSGMYQEKKKKGVALLAVDGTNEHLVKNRDHMDDGIDLCQVFRGFDSYPSYYLYDEKGNFVRRLDSIRDVHNL